MRNLEAKFRLDDLATARVAAERLGYRHRETWRQRDTFLRVEHGKLKLREEPAGAALIHYGRERHESLQLSNYEIVSVVDAEKMRAMLSAALEVLAEVRKERTLLIRGNVRLHLDRVDGLGDFCEIEAVIADGDDPDRSRVAIAELLAALGIDDANLIDVSYFELMTKS